MIWLLSRKQRDDQSLIQHGAHLDQTQVKATGVFA